MGAWIEIYSTTPFLKQTTVAPLVGAWIEISLQKLIKNTRYVAPLVGAWIEIPSHNESYHIQ